MIWYILIGFVSGIISGMGIGGGTLLIPALSFFFDMSQQSAQSINLVYFLPTACAALSLHAKEGNIEKRILPGLILSGLIAAAAGSFIALKMDSEFLRRVFGGFLLLIGVSELFRKDK